MPKKSASLRDLGDDELLRRLNDAKEELFQLRFQLATGQQENFARVGKLQPCQDVQQRRLAGPRRPGDDAERRRRECRVQTVEHAAFAVAL